MWHQTTKIPAWVSLTELPQASLREARSLEVLAIQKVLNDSQSKVERLYLGERFLKMYRVQMAEQDVLLRWLPGDRGLESQGQFELARWLESRGLSTPRAVLEPQNVAHVKDVWESGHVVGYAYHDFGPLKSEPRDLFELGKVLAVLHKLLPDSPLGPRWKEETRQRLSHLVDARKRLASGEWKCGPKPEALKKLAAQADLDFVRSDLASSFLHGDLNFANALVNKNGQTMILDFEDVHHSYLPREFEFAYALERFVMVQESSDAQKVESAIALLKGYREQNGFEVKFNSNLWLSIVQSINLRSLCVLSSIEKQGGEIPEGEWLKFFMLFDRAREQSSLWSQIS